MQESDTSRAAGRLAIDYMMAIAGEVLRRFPIDMLDLLLITIVANHNVMSPEKPQDLGSVSPDRAGISRNAISRALNIPLETVRRRIAALIEKKVLADRPDGLVFSSDNPIGIGNNADLLAFNLERLRQLFRALKTHGVDLD